MTESRTATFTGRGEDFFVFQLIQAFLVIITLGLYIPFRRRALRNWRYQRTIVEGQAMCYRASLMDWLGHTILNLFLVVITFGLYFPWAIASGVKYALEHTFLEDGRRFAFDGTGGQVIGLLLLSVLLIPISLGFALPWVLTLWLDWKWGHSRLSLESAELEVRGSLAIQSVEDGGWRSMVFQGQGGDLFGTFALNWFLTLCTLGIYGAWAAVNIMRWEAKYIAIGTETFQQQSSSSSAEPAWA